MKLDSNLSFNKHLALVIKKAQSDLWAGKSIIGKNYGITPKTAKWIYEKIVLPKLIYGSIVWYHKIDQTNFKHALEKVRRSGHSLISGAFKSTPFALSDLTQIHLLIKGEAWITNYRFSIREKELCDENLNLKMNDAIFRKEHTDIMLSEYIFDKRFIVEFPSREEWNENTVLNDPGDITWFTDGSKTETGIGFGMYRSETGDSFCGSVENTATVFKSKIQAISICAKNLLNDNPEERDIQILSDSKSALKALNGNKIKSKQVWTCIQRLKSLAQNNYVKLTWVPGKANILENEMDSSSSHIYLSAIAREEAIASAREGSSKVHPKGKYVCGVSIENVRKLIEKKIIENNEYQTKLTFNRLIRSMRW